MGLDDTFHVSDGIRNRDLDQRNSGASTFNMQFERRYKLEVPLSQDYNLTFHSTSVLVWIILSLWGRISSLLPTLKDIFFEKHLLSQQVECWLIRRKARVRTSG